MPRKLAPLSEVVRYRNARLVKYFAEEHNLSASESKALFDDLKKWLWLCANRDTKAQVHFFNDLRVLDLYWHTFLLFTRDYVEFCNRYFGAVVMHDPQPHRTARKQAGDPGAAREANLKRMRGSIVEVTRLLGEKQARRWYIELPEKYGSRFAKQFA